MEEYIKKEDALKAISDCGRADYWDTDHIFRSEAEDRIEAIPSVDMSEQKTSKWIPVSERLPEELDEVLVCVTHNGKSKMAVSCRRDYNYWDSWGRDIVGDMAWRPLPEPYKGGDTE